MIEDMRWLRERYTLERIEFEKKIQAVDRKITGLDREIYEVVEMVCAVRSEGG